MKQRIIPPGARLLTPTKTCDKFSKGPNWLWKRVRTDPDFPQPIYLDSRPHFLEGELDTYIAKKANEDATQRGPTLTAKRIEKRTLRAEAA